MTVRGAEVALEQRKSAIDDSQVPHASPALVADKRPAPEVLVFVTGNVVGRSLQRKVRRCKAEIVEEGLVREFLGVLLQAAESMVGDGGGGVVSLAGFHGRKRLVVFLVFFGGEIAVLICQVIRAIEPVLQRSAVHMPFTGMIAAISKWPEHLGQQARPRRADALAAAFNSGNRIATDLLRVVAGEEDAARRPAAGRVVELREPQAILRQPVEDRRLNFTTVAAEVGVAQIIGQDDQDIRTSWWARGAQFRERNQQQRGKTGTETLRGTHQFQNTAADTSAQVAMIGTVRYVAISYRLDEAGVEAASEALLPTSPVLAMLCEMRGGAIAIESTDSGAIGLAKRTACSHRFSSIRSVLASAAFSYQILRIEFRSPRLAGIVRRPCQLFRRNVFSTEKAYAVLGRKSMVLAMTNPCGARVSVSGLRLRR